MSDAFQSEVYASIATLDQLKRLYDLGDIDVRFFERESRALINEVQRGLEQMKRLGLDVQAFLTDWSIHQRFPEAANLLGLVPAQPAGPTWTAGQWASKEEFYDYLGLLVLDVATKHSSKGLIGLAEMIVEVLRSLPNPQVAKFTDVIEAVNRVSGAGLIPGIRTLKGGVKVVELRPLELRRDQADVINLAAGKGYVSLEEVMMNLGWSEDHARRVLASLVEAGIAVVSLKYSTGGRYYFPGLRPMEQDGGPDGSPTVSE